MMFLVLVLSVEGYIMKYTEKRIMASTSHRLAS